MLSLIEIFVSLDAVGCADWPFNNSHNLRLRLAVLWS